jgi:hypothetical protein
VNAQEPGIEDRATRGDVEIVAGAICLGAIALSLTFIDRCSFLPAREGGKMPLVLDVAVLQPGTDASSAVLAPEEVRRVLAMATTLKARVMLTPPTGAGWGPARWCGSRPATSTVSR